MLNHYYLGCPIWSNKDWVGTLFSAEAKSKDFLKQYANVLNSVEGNSTFYGVPRQETVLKWKAEVPQNFRFCFKFPRDISHQLQLKSADKETTHFFKTLEPLGENLGVFFLQMPPGFDKTGLKQLGRYLRQLPTGFKYAVEVRHPDYFDEGEVEKYFHDVLQNYGANRVMFDTITLHGLDSEEPSVLTAQGKKPKIPPRFVVTAEHPFLRFVGSNVVEPNIPRLKHIAKIAAQWIQKGLSPYFFMHSPSDQYAPELCQTFHSLLSQHLPPSTIGEMPNWASELPETGQLSLF